MIKSDNDKYIIYPIEPFSSIGLKLGQQIVLCPDGEWADLNGAYCEWPKREPLYFKVVDSIKIKNENLKLTDKMLLKELNKELQRKPVKFYQKLNKLYKHMIRKK